MAKVHHLKNKKGNSFTVTSAGLAEIKQKPNWRHDYDYVGEVDEEEFSGQSESAQKEEVPVTKDKKTKLGKNEKEESNDEIFKAEENEKTIAKALTAAGSFIDKKKYKSAEIELAKVFNIDPENEEAKKLAAEIEALTKK